MRKLYIITFILFSFSFQKFIAQEITGIATYKSFMKLDVKMDSTQVPKELQTQLLESIKQQTQKEYELQFNNSESVFKEKEQLERPSNSAFSGAMVTSSGSFGSYYINVKEKKILNQRDLYGKLFLISDTLKKQDWELEKETKNIGEYTCFKATKTRIPENSDTGEKKEIQIVAWYTPQIPVPFGPLSHNGLPGLILEVNDGVSSYLCSQIVLNPKSGLNFEPPKKGKKVSKEEFEKIQSEKIKEMQERNDFPGSKTIEIKIGG